MVKGPWSCWYKTMVLWPRLNGIYVLTRETSLVKNILVNQLKVFAYYKSLHLVSGQWCCECGCRHPHGSSFGCHVSGLTTAVFIGTNGIAWSLDTVKVAAATTMLSRKLTARDMLQRRSECQAELEHRLSTRMDLIGALIDDAEENCDSSSNCKSGSLNSKRRARKRIFNWKN